MLFHSCSELSALASTANQFLVHIFVSSSTGSLSQAATLSIDSRERKLSHFVLEPGLLWQQLEIKRK